MRILHPQNLSTVTSAKLSMILVVCLYVCFLYLCMYISGSRESLGSQDPPGHGGFLDPCVRGKCYGKGTLI